MRKTIILVILAAGLASGYDGMPYVPAGNSSTMLYEMTDAVRLLPVTADYKVSETKSRGEAIGPMEEGDRLRREATAKALGQDPPSADGADVLVGRKVFTEVMSGRLLKVTVTGYPAWYTNFRTVEEAAGTGTADSAWLIVLSPGAAPQTSDHPAWAWDTKQPPIEKTDAAAEQAADQPRLGVGGYFAAGRNLFGSKAIGGEWLNLESGFVWGRNAFLGLEVGGGYWEDRNSYYYDNAYDIAAGANLNFGAVYVFPHDIKLVYGGTLGVKYTYHKNYEYSGGYRYTTMDYFVGIGGPFVKVRFYGFELSYRMLVGYEWKEREREYNSSGYYDSNYYYDDGVGFASDVRIGYTYETKRKLKTRK